MNASGFHVGAEFESLDSLASRVEHEYQSRHGRSPQWVVAAPGRVNLIGEHIDYNDGFVLPMAIQRYVVIAAGPAAAGGEKRARVFSSNLGQSFELPLARTLRPGTPGWSGYVTGVLAGFAARGADLVPFDAVLESNVPLGGGLSSSAALEVATATLLEAMLDLRLDAAEKALLCQKAEHEYAGVPCGIMDQFCSVFGQENTLMLLDCRSQQIEQVPFAADDILVLITNSNVKHELASGEYARRRAACDSALEVLGLASWRDATHAHLSEHAQHLDETEYRRARHVISEIQRTTEAACAIRACNWDALGRLMYASHESLRDDYEVSCAELDLLVDLAREIGPAGGVIGSRMTGGGFGGCVVSLVRADSAAELAETMGQRYQSQTGIEPHSFATRPSRGAHVVRRVS